MEIGIGIHGEPGVKRGKLENADRIPETLVEQIVSDIPSVKGDSVSALLNSLGATPKEEFFVIVLDALVPMREAFGEAISAPQPSY